MSRASQFLCAICVRRPAIGWEVIDGKRRPCCFDCVEVPVGEVRHVDNAEHPTSSRRVLLALWRLPGSTLDDLRELFGIPRSVDDYLAYDRLMRSVAYLHKTGRLTATKTQNDYGMPVLSYSIAPHVTFDDVVRVNLGGRPRKEAA